jgi:outer membrane protein assembly factor BamB
MALDANTGEELWSFSSGSEGVLNIAAANGVLYTTGWQASKVYALSPLDGSVLWSYALDCSGGELVVAHGLLFVTSCNQVYAFTNQN